MKRALMLFMAAVLILNIFSAPGAAQLVEPTNTPDEAILSFPEGLAETLPNRWFVEFKSPSIRAGGSEISLLREKTLFETETQAVGVDFQLNREFRLLWNGVSITASSYEANKIARLSSVKAVFPMEIIHLPEVTPLEDPEMATAVHMTGANIAQEWGFTGEGIKVAIMDTGIDYVHPDLGDCFGPGCRVFTGWDFVGDAFDAATPGSVPVPDDNPLDCNGHGTHVAGIVGANGVVTGVAPEVTFGAYKVFGCTGSTTADIMIAAMEMALEDGMDVLNMSIGSAFQWPQYPTAVAASKLVDEGMVVVASIGNSGANGVFSAGAPGLGDKVIGVASFDNSHISLAKFTISPDDYGIGYAPAAASPNPPTSGSLEMARTGTPTTADDACSPLLAGSLADQAVLIRRGTCAFHTKALNAQNAGAAAVVLYNNAAGRFSPTVAGTPAITIPVVAISDTEGVLINNRLDSGPVTMTWTDEQLVAINPTGGLISSFSSYGLSPDLTLKPDIGAPGGLIRSTYPLALGGYATISGTSMSSPHVAGAVALLLEARPGVAAEDVRTILQNSADPKMWQGNPALGFLDQVHRQGAGMLNIPEALTSTMMVAPSKLSLGATAADPVTKTITITNLGLITTSYIISHTPALATGGSTFNPGAANAPSTVTFSAASITVPPGGSVTVDVSITAAAGLANLSQYGGYIVFTPVGAGQVYRVPFAGFKGNYQAITVLAPAYADPYGFPWLAFIDGDGFFDKVLDNGRVFTMEGDDIPFVAAHFRHQSRKVLIEIMPLDDLTKTYDLSVWEYDYFGRNSTAGGFFAYEWDGTALDGEKFRHLPDGDYQLKLSVLKALGDPENTDHWETWTSPTFTIERPGTWDVSIAPLTAEKTGYPGSQLVYELTITNLGSAPDSFDVVSGVTDWAVNFSDAIIGPLDPGQSATVEVFVTIPDKEKEGNKTIDITVTSEYGDETSTASATLTATTIYRKLYLPLMNR
jgi:minor extracellular serine protease Vpr